MDTITVETESHTVKNIRQFWSRCRRALRKKGIINDMFEDWYNWRRMPFWSKDIWMSRAKDDLGKSWMQHAQDDFYEGVANVDGTGYKIVFTVSEEHGYFYYEERNA